MNDKELADKVVAIVDLRNIRWWSDDYQFVRDWRVAGALIEKTTHAITITCCEDDYCIEITDYTKDEEAKPIITRVFDPNSRCRAIIEACVEAKGKI